MDIGKITCELLEVEGSFNVRDLGGYRTARREQVKKRRFIRAGSLTGLTPKGKEQLLTQGVRCVVDLRSASEVARHPDPLSGHGGISYHNIPMLDYIQSNIDSGDFSSFPKSLEEMYTGLLDHARAQLGQVFRVFAAEDTAILFHCTAGKDRTGVVTMLLLSLAGVNEQAIAEDYSWSAHLIAPLLQSSAGKNFPAYGNESKAETMRAVMEHLRENYGSAGQYLEAAGVDAGVQRSIVEKLLV